MTRDATEQHNREFVESTFSRRLVQEKGMRQQCVTSDIYLDQWFRDD